MGSFPFEAYLVLRSIYCFTPYRVGWCSTQKSTSPWIPQFLYSNDAWIVTEKKKLLGWWQIFNVRFGIASSIECTSGDRNIIIQEWRGRSREQKRWLANDGNSALVNTKWRCAMTQIQIPENRLNPWTFFLGKKEVPLRIKSSGTKESETRSTTRGQHPPHSTDTLYWNWLRIHGPTMKGKYSARKRFSHEGKEIFLLMWESTELGCYRMGVFKSDVVFVCYVRM